MPSLLAEEPQQQAHQQNNHDDPRRSGSPTGTRLPSAEKAVAPTKPNGTVSDSNGGVIRPNGGGLLNGTTTGLQNLTNGTGRQSTERQTPSRNGSLVSMGTGRSLKMENGVHAGSDDGRGTSRDDGFFARAEGATVSQGLTSTHVSLGGLQPTNAPLERVADEMQLDGPSTARSSKEGRLTNGDTISSLTDSTTNPKDRRSSVDASSLRIPVSAHRVSSPPVFQRDAGLGTSGSSSTLASQAPPRLQHRHTLEVPKVTTSRTSKEFSGLGASDDIMTTGRFSPATPTRRRGSISLVRRGTRSIHSDMHLDEVPQDEEAARWAEHIRQKRASKRKRKEDEDDDRVVVGIKVDQNHVNWVTAYNMLTGIRFTVSRTHAKMDRDLTDADFRAKHKFSFDITGNELTPSAKYDFKFKDYAPWVFRHLRSIFKIDPADYLMSLTSKYILSELGSPGKSGSFFYFSRDYKYIIKTIHHSEHKFLRKVLRDYYDHVRQNPNTLLSQFYGLHRVKIPYGRKIHFVVMNNLFPPHRDIHRTFDLKGSTIGRDFREEDLDKNPRATLKDLNWLRRNLHLEFGPTKRSFFIEQMEKDVELLQRLKIMDYSLLVGIHDLERGNEDNLRDKTLQVFQPGGEAGEDAQATTLMRTPSKLETARKAKELRQIVKTQKPVPVGQTADKMPEDVGGERKDFYFYSDDGGFRATHEDNTPGEEIYYLGIIDCLTYYSVIKRGEHFFKGLVNTESQISAIPPERYGDRFIRFISGITKSREQAEKEKIEDMAARTDSIDDPNLTGVNILPHAHHRNSTDPIDRVMEKAETQAERSRRHGAREDNVPDRVMKSARSPSAERTGGEMGHILPVVEEALESSSTGGRSGDVSPSPGMRPPPTPPKDERTEYRPPTPPKDGHLRSDRSPPTPPKDRPLSANKTLPVLPPSARGLADYSTSAAAK